MRIIKETEKGVLVEQNGVPFWIQKRWLKPDGSMTPAGNKAYWIASREYWKHWGFDACVEFPVIRETAQAVLLQCTISLPHENRKEQAQFWLPRSMTGNYQFVQRKVKEIEDRCPFIGARVQWASGRGMSA